MKDAGLEVERDGILKKYILQETSGVAADWRGELLQAVQSVFEKERNVLQIELKSHFSNPASGDTSSLGEKLEYIMKQQVWKALKSVLLINHFFIPFYFFSHFYCFCC